jgi:endoglucanase
VTSRGTWDPTNDWSYTGLPSGGAQPATTDHIVLTDATGTVLWGRGSPTQR